MRLTRRYRPRTSSILFVGVTAFLGVGAIQSEPNLLPLVFGVAISVVLVSGLVGGTMLMGLRPKRLRVAPAQVGVTWRVRYELRSRARLLPSFALQVTEKASKRRAHWERHFSRKGGAGRAFIAQIGPRERVRAVGRFMPLKRGVVDLEGVEVSSGFPFGLFHKSVVLDQPARVLIRPRVRTLRPGVLPDMLANAGRERSLRRSDRTGDEYFALREYTPGDSPRFIAWRASARMDTLVVREHARRTTRRVRLVLLVSPGATEDDAERAIELAASFAGAIGRADATARVEIPQVGYVENDARHSSFGRVLDALAMLDRESQAPVEFPPSADPTIYVRTDEVASLPPVHKALVFTSADLERCTFPIGEQAGGDA